MFHLMQDVISRLIPSGIPQHLLKYYEWSRFRESLSKNTKIPKVLKMEDLEFGFILWIGSCAFTVVAFACEIVLKKILHVLKVAIGIYYVRKGIENYVQSIR